MRATVRWGIAITGSLGVFATSFALCRYPARLNDGAAWAIAGAALAVTIAVLGWWAAHDSSSPSTASSAASTATAGDSGQAIIGNPGVVIGGKAKLRGTIAIHPSQDGPQPSTPAPVRPTPIGPVIAGDIPRQPPAFQPRDTLLATLRDHSDERGVCVIHAVTGMRGTGKTQAAASYARQRIKDKWRLVAWVNADTSDSILNGLTATATTLGIAAPGDDQTSAAQVLRHWLETDGHHCLVVFDNVTAPMSCVPICPPPGTPTSSSLAPPKP